MNEEQSEAPMPASNTPPIDRGSLGRELWVRHLHQALDTLIQAVFSGPDPDPRAVALDVAAYSGITGASQRPDPAIAEPAPLLSLEGVSISCIGSRNDTLHVRFNYRHGIEVSTGCFDWAPLAIFEEENERVHGRDRYGQEYRAAIRFIRQLAEIRSR